MLNSEHRHIGSTGYTVLECIAYAIMNSDETITMLLYVQFIEMTSGFARLRISAGNINKRIFCRQTGGLPANLEIQTESIHSLAINYQFKINRWIKVIINRFQLMKVVLNFSLVLTHLRAMSIRQDPFNEQSVQKETCKRIVSYIHNHTDLIYFNIFQYISMYFNIFQYSMSIYFKIQPFIA